MGSATPLSENFEVSLHESVTIQHRPAPIIKRILAYTVDLGIVSTFLYIVIIGLAIFMGVGAVLLKTFFENLDENIRGIVIFSVLFAFMLVLGSAFEAYFIYFELKNGQTPGKKLFGMRVIALDANRLTFAHVAKRAVMRMVDCYLVLPGLLSMMLNDRKQRLGDLMASTMVVYSSQMENQHDYIYLPQSEFEEIHAQVTQTNVLESGIPFDRKTAEAFLARAFSYFLMGQTQIPLLEDTRYLQLATDTFPKLKHLIEHEAMAPESALRYFSQRCFDLVNQQGEKK